MLQLVDPEEFQRMYQEHHQAWLAERAPIVAAFKVQLRGLIHTFGLTDSEVIDTCQSLAYEQMCRWLDNPPQGREVPACL